MGVKNLKIGSSFKGPLILLLIFQKHPWLWSSFFFFFDVLATWYIRLSKWKYQLDIFPPSPSTNTMLADEKKKSGSKIFNGEVRFNRSRGGRKKPNCSTLNTHVFHTRWVFFNFHSYNFRQHPSTPGQLSMCGWPISRAFPSSHPPLGHINATLCHKRYHRWPEQVLKKKKMKWKPVRVALC